MSYHSRYIIVQLLVRADAAIISAMRSKETLERNFVLIVTTVPIFLAAFMGSSVNIALPTIGKEFGMSAVSLGWVATAFLLTTAMFQVPFGRIADIHGRKKVSASAAFSPPFLAGISVERKRLARLVRSFPGLLGLTKNLGLGSIESNITVKEDDDGKYAL